jgi:hypothetical protein
MLARDQETGLVQRLHELFVRHPIQSDVTPSPPAEKTTARHDQARKSRTGDGSGDRHSNSFERNAVGRACWSKNKEELGL